MTRPGCKCLKGRDMQGNANDWPEEHKLLLRDLKQAARTLLDVNAQMNYAMAEFRLVLQHEALRRTKDNRTKAARLLGVHRNTFTRGLPVRERKNRERYEDTRRPRTVLDNRLSAQAG